MFSSKMWTGQHVDEAKHTKASFFCLNEMREIERKGGTLLFS
jgi:hypothetical protein